MQLLKGWTLPASRRFQNVLGRRIYPSSFGGGGCEGPSRRKDWRSGHSVETQGNICVNLWGLCMMVTCVGQL